MADGGHPRIALGTFIKRGDHKPFAGVALADTVVPIGALAELADLGDATMRTILDGWDANWPRLASAIARELDAPAAARLSLETLTPQVPIEPRQIVCAGANYRRHVIEMMTDHDVASDTGLSAEDRHARAVRLMDHRAAQGQPFAFVKPVSTLLASGSTLALPVDSAEVDWEIELAVVIGRDCYRTPRAEALSHVAGYTIANDVSARDRLSRRDFPGLGLDWIAGKSAPGFLPLGPLIVPAALVANPNDLMLTLTLNGIVMQHESTADMIFPVARLIEHVSTYMRLLPGDVLCTGSPAGNGTRYGRYLEDGDLIEAHIEGLGVQTTRCAREQVSDGLPVHRPFVPLPDPQNQG